MATDTLPPFVVDRHISVPCQGRQELGEGGILHGHLSLRRSAHSFGSWGDLKGGVERNPVFHHAQVG